jgi:hypothetical protein
MYYIRFGKKILPLSVSSAWILIGPHQVLNMINKQISEKISFVVIIVIIKIIRYSVMFTIDTSIC